MSGFLIAPFNPDVVPCGFSCARNAYPTNCLAPAEDDERPSLSSILPAPPTCAGRMSERHCPEKP